MRLISGEINQGQPPPICVREDFLGGREEYLSWDCNVCWRYLGREESVQGKGENICKEVRKNKPFLKEGEKTAQWNRIKSRNRPTEIPLVDLLQRGKCYIVEAFWQMLLKQRVIYKQKKKNLDRFYIKN